MTIKKHNVYVAVIGVPVSIATFFWSAWVLTVVWSWIMVPTFALPGLTIAQAIGIRLIYGSFNWINARSEEMDRLLHPYRDDAERYWKQVGLRVAAPTVFLGVGWIVSFFI